MKFARLISLLLAIGLILGVATSCRDNTGTSSTESPTSSEEIDYNSELPVGSDASKTESEFDDGDESRPTPTPGSSDYSNTSDGDGDVSGPSEEEPFEPVSSALDNPDNIAYIYDSNPNYVYAITVNDVEVIAFKEPDGSYFDVITGGGHYYLSGSSGRTLVEVIGIESYETTIQDNQMALIVRYLVFGVNTEGAIVETTYTFYENSIGVSARVSYTGTEPITSGTIRRTYLNGYEDTVKNWSTDWVYPEDGDYPYRYIDSWVTVQNLDANHKLYTYNRGNIPERYWDFYVRYPETNIPLFYQEEGEDAPTGLDYTAQYDLVLERSDPENSGTANKKSPDYLALFKSHNSDFAAGIAPMEAEEDGSTVFVGDSVELNMNVTNLVDRDIEFSVRYDVHDYYGNIVAADIFINSTAFEGLDANRSIKIDASKWGYGIYFLNFKVVSEYYSYQEYYPFMIIPEHEYKYNATSPFGINQAGIYQGSPVQMENNYSLFNKIGIAVSRGGFETDDYEKSITYLKLLKQKGIRMISQNGGNEEYLQMYGDYYQDCIYGNEYNMEINGKLPNITEEEKDEVWNRYYNESYVNARLLADKYNKTLVYAGISGGATDWYDRIARQGLWNLPDILSVHVYSGTASPDNLSQTQADYIWGMEAGLVRTQNAILKYGPKTWQINETGFYTTVGRGSVDIRLQADYNMRCNILSVAYGAESVAAYCFYDFSNSGIGTVLDDMEWHYGHFYLPDYFGRTLPKPAAAAFAALTRYLESVEKSTDTTMSRSQVSESAKYSSKADGLRRVFELQTKEYGKVFYAWSNAYPHQLDQGQYRIAQMPWKEIWQGTEDVVFDAAGATVRVVDVMGNEKVYTANNGKVTIPLSGSPVIIIGAR